MLPSRTANSVHVMKMCQALGRAGHEVTLFGAAGAGAEVFETYGVERVFEIVRVPRMSVRFLGEALFAARIAARVHRLPRPDLLYARSFASLSLVAHLNVRMIYEIHDIPATPIQRAMEDRLTRRANFCRLVSISDALREEYLRLFPHLDPELAVTCRDGADLPAVGVTAQELGGRAGVVQVGYTGHLYRGRGVEVILQLALDLPDVDFHIVGGEPTDVVEWRSRSTAENLHFHGHVPHAQVDAYLAAFDIVLAPYQASIQVAGGRGDISRWLSPMKLFEYMAHGKAIVCSGLPVLREILDDGETALLVGPTDQAGWCSAVARLVRDRELRARLGRSARESIERRYTWDARAGCAVPDHLRQTAT